NQPAFEEAQKNLILFENEKSLLSEKIIPLRNKVEQLSMQLAQDSNKLVQTSSKIESLNKEIEYKQQTLETSIQRLQSLKSEQSKIEEETKILLENTNLEDDHLIALYEEKENLENGLREAEVYYYKIRASIDELEKENKETFRKRENADSLIMELQNTLNSSVVEFASVKERLIVEFQIDIDQELEKNPNIPEISENELSELKRRNESVKASIDKIGPINPMAMEAYQEINQRHQFITSQKNDLLEAKNILTQTISEIDEVAKTTFLEAFTNIRENFIKVFRSLFSDEDSCDLKLVNPNEPTESDIDIIARPKGKRPLTINQLSGGEKTLTAISLLFAIYLLKPAPFCIFDEVDAPLDDANIDKFNNIIRKFSSESQFIIVTHNKRTMASTDIIYGVTMVEQGVSRVVPVDLRELN
ncbi:MAG: chromosome segregation protein SMC, partial [Cytophagales bacterium]